MNVENNLLTDFEETVNYKPRVKTLISKIYAFQIVLSLVAYFVTLNTAKIEPTTILSSKINFLLFAFERVFPFFALALFIYRKQLGWILVLILSSLDVLFKGDFLISILADQEKYIPDSPFLLILQTLTFLFASVVPILLFLRSVLGIFTISTKLKLISLSTALLIFLAIKFYMTNLAAQVS